VKIPTLITTSGVGIGTTAVGLPALIVVLCVLASVVPSVLDYLADRDQRRRQFDFANRLLGAMCELPERDRVALGCHLAQALDQSPRPPSPADPSSPVPPGPTVCGTPS